MEQDPKPSVQESGTSDRVQEQLHDGAGVPGRMNARRRALLRSGAVAAPVLVTLHSGPVSAATACTVASSFVSAATFASRSPGTTFIRCSAKNATTWQAAAATYCTSPSIQQWPAWAAVRVKDHLVATNSSYDDMYVGAVMKMSLASSGELAILQHVLGLTLTLQYDGNAITTAGSSGGTLTKSYLVEIWQTYRSTGAYRVPASNVNWDAAGLLTWLKMLQYDIPVA